jgi:iron complex transport system ATP-binding protein
MDLMAEAVTVVGRLREVSVGLAAGRVTVVCGPNGAGKSTLLAVLAGLQAPDAGRVVLGHNRLTDLTRASGPWPWAICHRPAKWPGT